MTDTIKRDVLKEMSIDAILDLGVDQIQEIAERTLLPSAQYQLHCTDAGVEAGTESSGAYIQVELEVVATVELVNPEDAELTPEDGTKFRPRYYTGYGIENFKTTFSDLAEQLEEQNGTPPTVREILEAIVGTSWETLIEHKQRKDKETGELKEFNEMNPHLTALIGATE